jgi:hypothetical protein
MKTTNKKQNKKTLFAIGAIAGFAAAVAYSAGAYTWQTVGGATGKFYNGVNSLDAVYALGKVGIGTTTPAFDLHIEGTTNLGGDVYHEGNRVNIGGKWTDGSTSTQAVYNGGYVGVGTTNPTSLFHVNNTGSANSASFYLSDGDNWSSYVSELGGGGYNPLSASGDQGIIFSNDSNPASSSGGFIIAPHSSALSGIRILENGNIGMGIAAPSVELEVSGTITSDEFIYSSDLRLKENISDLDNYKNVLNLSPKRFDWKQKDGLGVDSGDIGLIAQDLEKYFPEFVSEGDDGYKGINYQKLVVPLISILKDQQDEIDRLRKEIDNLTK